ncbi:hypothetical protein CHS0354_027937 [Potamilus streckersoni]|uniref:Uncharacterized protein n=1 Tax=Potamilus streckersoni TaxID=2493646 RepID=A0AAE0T489_9BIVA|nr:hypothetical protein CHS0354_027937 [Potamilus streckersoni]
MEVIFEIEEAESIKQTIELDTSSDMKQNLDKMVRADDRIKAGNETNDSCVTLQNSISSIDEEKNQESSRGSMSSEELGSLLEQSRELKDKMTCKICMDNEVILQILTSILIITNKKLDQQRDADIQWIEC